jgi:hypothetical protein
MAKTPAVPDELARYLDGVVGEYEVYVASGPINIGNARAFNDGDPVPVSHVESGIVPRDMVELRSDRIARGAEVPMIASRPVGADSVPTAKEAAAALAANVAAGAVEPPPPDTPAVAPAPAVGSDSRDGGNG